MTPKTRTRLRWSLLAVGVLSLPVAYKVARRVKRYLNAPPPAPTFTAPLATARLDPGEIVEVAYDGALKEGWFDFGWAPRELGSGPAKVNFAKESGWIFAKPSLKGSFGELVFRMKSPAGDADFLEVQVQSASQTSFPHVLIKHDNAMHVEDGWDEVHVPFALLDPDDVAFDRVVLHATKSVSYAYTLLDKIVFTRADPSVITKRLDPAGYAGKTKPALMRVSCNEPSTKISPQIYGIAYNFMEEKNEAQWQAGASIRRWGGNPTTTYNWEKNVWSLGSDWFFENVSVPPYTAFLDASAKHGMQSALTVPIMGWVSKDATSCAFPVSVFGAQGKTDAWRSDCGDGTQNGKEMKATDPSRTAIPITPDFVRRWVEAIRARDAEAGARSVAQYILDNEPAIWQSTHRDLRPEGVGYDELVQRTIDFGEAIRKADPDAVIAGPAEYGWLGYFYSGKDSSNGWSKEDRKAHGDVPFIEWYLRKIREHDEKTGVRTLDVVDLHFYPQEENVYAYGAGGIDEKTAALRIRSTRGLWDPEYVDESWIKDKIRLLPRMKEWIASNYPGRGISIGEWSFGGQTHPSGGIATAEALGRFAQFGVTSAYYWIFPPAESPTMTAFLAYRNFDGKGGRFLDEYVPSTAPVEASLFASKDASGKHLVLVAINPSPDTALDASIDLTSCGPSATHTAFAYVRGARGLLPSPAGKDAGASITQFLPPYSFTAIDVHLAP